MEQCDTVNVFTAALAKLKQDPPPNTTKQMVNLSHTT